MNPSTGLWNPGRRYQRSLQRPSVEYRWRYLESKGNVLSQLGGWEVKLNKSVFVGYCCFCQGGCKLAEQGGLACISLIMCGYMPCSILGGGSGGGTDL